MRVTKMTDEDDGSVIVEMSASFDEIKALAEEMMLAKITHAAMAPLVQKETEQRIRRLKSSLTEAKLEVNLLRAKCAELTETVKIATATNFKLDERVFELERENARLTNLLEGK